MSIKAETYNTGIELEQRKKGWVFIATVLITKKKSRKEKENIIINIM